MLHIVMSHISFCYIRCYVIHGYVTVTHCVMLHYAYITLGFSCGFVSSGTRYVSNAEILTVARAELPGSLEAQSLSCVSQSVILRQIIIRLFSTFASSFSNTSLIYS